MSSRLIQIPRWAVASGGLPAIVVRSQYSVVRQGRYRLVHRWRVTSDASSQRSPHFRPLMATGYLSLNLHPHAPRGPGDDPARVLEVTGVEVGELGLRDL